MTVAFLLQAIEQMSPVVDAKPLDFGKPGPEDVVAAHSRDSHKKAYRCGNKGFCYARGNSGKGNAFHLRNGCEGLHDAPHSSEKPYEGRRIGCCGKERQRGFQPGNFSGYAEMQGTTDIFAGKTLNVACPAQAVEFVYGSTGNIVQGRRGIPGYKTQDVPELPRRRMSLSS